MLVLLWWLPVIVATCVAIVVVRRRAEAAQDRDPGHLTDEELRRIRQALRRPARTSTQSEHSE